MITLDLSDKTIVITGALGAIAQAVIDVLTKAGAFVILVDLKPEAEASAIIAQRGHDPRKTAYYRLDVTKAADVPAAVDAMFARHPGINIVLGNAGGTLIKDFYDMDMAGFMDTFHMNFTGQVYLTQAVLKHWVPAKTKGHFIYTTTWVSRIPWKGISAYTSSKAALDMFAKTLALEHAKDGIRFNLIAPGNVAAGASKFLYDRDPAYKADVDRISPLGHRNSPESIANGFLYLCSHLGDEVDGHILNVDAGVGLPKVQL